jgi:excisionase family DNA binding protein
MQDAGRDDRGEAMTVAEASERLGISKEAVRKRISRGTLRADRDSDGMVRVYVLPSDTPSGTVTASELVEELRDQVRYLRQQLDQERAARTEERRRHDTLMAQLTSRIPELPPGSATAEGSSSSEARESPETAADEQQGRGPVPDAGGLQEPILQEPISLPWWRRMFGG